MRILIISYIATVSKVHTNSTLLNVVQDFYYRDFDS